MPFVLSAGMGLNAYFAYTVVIGMGYSWQQALAAVFVEGIIFIFLSLINIREAIFNAIPSHLKIAVSVGIGLFISFIGFKILISLLKDQRSLQFFLLNLQSQTELLIQRESQFYFQSLVC